MNRMGYVHAALVAVVVALVGCGSSDKEPGGGDGGSSSASCDQAKCKSCLGSASDPNTCASACQGCNPDTSGPSESDAGSAPSGKALGESCSSASDCASNDCPFGLNYCSQGCTTFADCPSFWDCKAVGASAQRYCQK